MHGRSRKWVVVVVGDMTALVGSERLQCMNCSLRVSIPCHAHTLIGNQGVVEFGDCLGGRHEGCDAILKCLRLLTTGVFLIIEFLGSICIMVNSSSLRVTQAWMKMNPIFDNFMYPHSQYQGYLMKTIEKRALETCASPCHQGNKHYKYTFPIYDPNAQFPSP